jgi:hypothetical protein
MGCNGRYILWFFAAMMVVASRGYAKPAAWLDTYLAPEAKAWHQQASAVVLVDQAEVRFLRPDRAAYHVFGAIRANTISGRERLRTRLPYNPDYMRVNSVQAWLVSPAGKITTVSQKEFLDTIMTMDTRMWDNRRVLSYDASQKAEIGSVLAWEFSFEAPVDFRDVSWRAETDLPLFHGQFEVVPARSCGVSSS